MQGFVRSRVAESSARINAGYREFSPMLWLVSSKDATLTPHPGSSDGRFLLPKVHLWRNAGPNSAIFPFFSAERGLEVTKFEKVTSKSALSRAGKSAGKR